jgi:hypothetical protein
MVMHVLQNIDYYAFIKIEIGKCRSQEKEYEISNLRIQLPKSYKINVNSAEIYYKNCSNEFIYFNCNYDYGTVITVYAQQDGYALTYYGWVYMSYLEKY